MSIKLYFVRHGQAGSREEWQGDDSQRPVTAQGKKRMQRAGAVMRKLDLPLDVIVSSPLTRAAQTAEILAKAWESAVRVSIDERLGPGFGPKQLKVIMAEHREARGVMLVGHEPDFSETISQVTGGGRLVMKKGALAYVEMDEPALLHGTLVWLIPPKMLEL